MNIFSEDYTTEGKLVYKMYTAVVWAVSLAREVRVVVVDYLDSDKNARPGRSSSQPTPQCQPATSSTSTGHVSNWNSSFAMPSNSPGSHTVRRETRKLCRLPSTPRSRPSTSLGHLPVSKGLTSRSVQPKHCCTTLQWWIDLLQCPENLRTCD